MDILVNPVKLVKNETFSVLHCDVTFYDNQAHFPQITIMHLDFVLFVTLYLNFIIFTVLQ